MTICETDRLLMRTWNKGDADFLFHLNSDPEVMRYAGEGPFQTVQDAAQLIENYDQYARYGHGRWICELKETGLPVGWCGLKYDEAEDFIDLGYRFTKENWGKGFATESAFASLKVGFESLALEEIIARAMKENEASLHVMHKLGMKFWKHDTCAHHPADYYRIRREEFVTFFQGKPTPSNVRILQ